MRPPDKPVAYFGHHKAASSWIRLILETLCRQARIPHAGFDNPAQFDHNLPDWLRAHPVRVISYTNAAWQDVEPLMPLRGIHLIRDPRDILVSAYHSHRNSHPTDAWPELLPHRQKLQALDTEDGLLEELVFSECYLRQIDTWTDDHPEILELRFEEVTAHPTDALLRAFAWLGLVDEGDPSPARYLEDAWLALAPAIRRITRGRWYPQGIPRQQIPADRVLRETHHHRFARKSGGRKRGQEDSKSHYRSGKAGGWRTSFTPRLQAAFEERYPGLVTRLGYPDWDS
ncbi:MAG: sulfotransferase domain-containing protein [Opitutales bacterium]